MNCAQVVKYLDAYVDGELEPERMIEVEAHLDHCEKCGALTVLRRRMKSEIAALGDGIVAPDHLRRRVESLPGTGTRRLKVAIFAAVPIAAAAALLAVLTVGPWSTGETGEEPMAAVVDDLARRHARELPMEFKGPDPSLAGSWFRGKVDFPVRAPQLKLSNASFQGARLSSVQAHQAAHMVYTVDGHRVTLMIFPVNKLVVRGGDTVRVDGKNVVLGRRNGYNVAVMIDGDMAYSLSSDLPSKRLISLFTELSI